MSINYLKKVLLRNWFNLIQPEHKFSVKNWTLNKNRILSTCLTVLKLNNNQVSVDLLFKRVRIQLLMWLDDIDKLSPGLFQIFLCTNKYLPLYVDFDGWVIGKKKNCVQIFTQFRKPFFLSMNLAGGHEIHLN